ncbi:hypothetical protein N0X72_17625 [Streptomyces carpaticus]|uniref:hypothetical protein n=1 Tax=Streptomyces carpaticus TaxID=285558 RepID=UPI00220A5262|nr:hypothetical protein N0X72_17625 [Streptomyces carpaticus]
MAPAPCAFDPAAGNRAEQPFPDGARARYVQPECTANSGRPAGQLSELELYRR